MPIDQSSDDSAWWSAPGPLRITIHPQAPANPNANAPLIPGGSYNDWATRNADDGYPDDWFVPEADGYPNDWFVPEADGYPNDWVPASSASPSFAIPAPTLQSGPLSPVTSNSPGQSPSASSAAGEPARGRPLTWSDYWTILQANGFSAAPPAAPYLANSPTPIPPAAQAPDIPWEAGENGLFGSFGRMMAAREAANNPPAAAASGLFGGLPRINAEASRADRLALAGSRGLFGPLAYRHPTTASTQTDQPFAPSLRAYGSPDLTGYQGADPLSADVRNDLVRSNPPWLSDQSPASQVTPDRGPGSARPNVLLVGNIDEEAERKREELKQQRDRAIFNERAFGITPPFGSGAPRYLPPLGNPGPRPPTAPAESSPARSASQPPTPQATRSAPGEAQLALPGILRERGAGTAESPGLPKAGAMGGGPLAPASRSTGARPPLSRDDDWRKLVENIERIKDAWAGGGAKLPERIAAALPKFDDKTTYGILITNEGDVVPLRSPGADPLFNNYPAATHVEGKAAIWIRNHGSSGGVLYHNNTGGTCGFCDSQLERLLPKNSELHVIPPVDAFAKKRGAVPYPSFYKGDDALPKLPPQLDLFRSR